MSPPDAVPVRPAAAQDRAQLATLFTVAFAPDPVACWLMPDPDERAAHAQVFFARVVDQALADPGTVVSIAADGSGALISYDHRHRNTQPAAGLGTDLLPVDVAPAAARRVALLHQMMIHVHPDVPHHHLGLLAVEPSRRRRGVAGALLANEHARLDASGTAAYAAAHTDAVAALLQHHGYRLNHPVQSHSGVRLAPAWRAPTPRRPPVPPPRRP